MIKIYHNPRCTKSRCGVQFLQDNKLDFEIINYLDNYFTKELLTEIITLLNIKPIQLIRKDETLWKENYSKKALTDIEIIEVMVLNPKLIQRPIVINNNKAIIARPTELINTIL